MERQDPEDEHVGHVGVDGRQCSVVPYLSDWSGTVEKEKAGQGL